MLGAEAPEAVLASEAVRPVLGADELVELRQSLATVTLREELIAYIVDIVRATRTDKSVLVGAGSRATQSLTAACRACAVLAERDFVVPDDIKDMAVPALAHRLILRPEFEIEGLTVEEAVRRLLQEVPVPR
jgi:MoxR-like ATPase